MSLDVAKLEQVRELPGGSVQARCPACAEGGHDRAGEHLRIYPDGRFGCCVHPKDGEHRKRIFALVGVRKPGTFSLRIKTPPAMPAIRSVKAALTAFNSGTPKTESGNGVPSVPPLLNELTSAESGTLGTAKVKLRARTREDCPTANIGMVDFHGELKDWESAVPSVPSVPGKERLPFLTADETLSIPFDSPERYHWWKGGQSIAETRNEVNERRKHAATV